MKARNRKRSLTPLNCTLQITRMPDVEKKKT